MPTPVPYPTKVPESRDDFPAVGPASIPTLWARLGARLFDNIVLLLPAIVLYLPYLDPDAPNGLANLPRWVDVVIVVIPVVYEFAFVAAVGATPGKMLLGIGVRRFVDGGRILPYQAGLRALVPALGGIFALLVTSGWAEALTLFEPLVYLTTVFDPMLRGVHDHAAGSIVVRTR
jgi:uncharacterized RDD family membrane protein YckC